MGQNLKDPVEKSICSWFDGGAFIPFIDNLPTLNRKQDGPFMMPIVDKYKDMGTVVMGKVESGECRKGQSLVIMPNRVSFNEFFTFYDLNGTILLTDPSYCRHAVERR